jgi:hypothetical protein
MTSYLKCAITLSALLVLQNACAYGPVGHEIIGALADEKLAHTPAGAKVAALLDGITLEKASVIPDEIRGWDKNGPDDPAAFHYSAHPRIDAQLRDYWYANPPTKDLNSPTPSHHWFHYTDVPEDNPRKITKSIAVILLAHFVGDIHQPLHVGAEFFDKTGHAINPGKTDGSLEDQGGNTLTLNLASGGTELARHSKFHGFWDSETVMANLPPMPETLSKEERHAKIEAAKKDLVHEFVTHEPRNWRLPSSIALKDYSQAWADEILPIAREAHERLQFKDVAAKTLDDGAVVAAGIADEKKSADGISYYDWAARTVREELPKAGWRLAEVLEKALK